LFVVSLHFPLLLQRPLQDTIGVSQRSPVKSGGQSHWNNGKKPHEDDVWHNFILLASIKKSAYF